jgi:hypothetical protein
VLVVSPSVCVVPVVVYMSAWSGVPLPGLPIPPGGFISISSSRVQSSTVGTKSQTLSRSKAQSQPGPESHSKELELSWQPPPQPLLELPN